MGYAECISLTVVSGALVWGLGFGFGALSWGGGPYAMDPGSLGLCSEIP